VAAFRLSPQAAIDLDEIHRYIAMDNATVKCRIDSLTVSNSLPYTPNWECCETISSPEFASGRKGDT
jgi:hypothetical protein